MHHDHIIRSIFSEKTPAWCLPQPDEEPAGLTKINPEKKHKDIGRNIENAGKCLYIYCNSGIIPVAYLQSPL
jgi:hypothetical protein